jgi:hypothetical protein
MNKIRTEQQIRDEARQIAMVHGWSQDQHDRFLQGMFALNDPDNSFYQEMKVIRDHPLDEETYKAIFCESIFGE